MTVGNPPLWVSTDGAGGLEGEKRNPVVAGHRASRGYLDNLCATRKAKRDRIDQGWKIVGKPAASLDRRARITSLKGGGSKVSARELEYTNTTSIL